MGATAVFICFIGMPFLAHRTIIEASSNFQLESVQSRDGKYLLIPHDAEDSSQAYTTFTIETTDTREMVYHCPDRYRNMDLKSIAWEDRTLDVRIQSGDVGTILYAFDNGTWERQ